MVTRVLSAGLLAGLLAGLAIAILQVFTTTPLILEAEVYENAAPAKAAALSGSLVSNAAFMMPDHGHGAGVINVHGDAHGAGAPGGEGLGGGRERLTSTALATVGAAVGLAFLLLGGMLISGDEIDTRRALAWAACGFLVTGLAPAAGLPPELPGMAAADLYERQAWWALTAAVTALSLWLFLRTNSWMGQVAALVLLVAPHVLGAPHLAPGDVEPSRVPAELAARFAAMSLAVHAALWLVTAFALGTLWPKLARVGAPRNAEPLGRSA